MDLAFGRLLRNVGRRHDALEQLRLARDHFEALGATAYLGRVDAELAATGFGRPRHRRSALSSPIANITSPPSLSADCPTSRSRRSCTCR
jgi:hypothetical protein